MSQSMDPIIVPASSEHPASAALDMQPIQRPAIPWVSTWIVLLSLSAALASILIISSRPAHFLPVLACSVCAIAALFDAWTGRIPNPLTYTAILLGLALNSLLPVLAMLHATTPMMWLGAAGPASSFLGFGACAVLGTLALLVAGVHGGDLKLLAALGALLGLTQTANALIIALGLAIAYALLNLLAFGKLNAVLRLAALRLLELAYLRRLPSPIDEPLPPASHIPMAIPLALGVIAAQWWLLRTGGTIL